MSIRINIPGGTPQSGKGLCHTCKHASIVRGQNCEERIICGSGIWQSTNGVVQFRVSDCKEFHPQNMAWLHEMREIAWRIEARRRGPTGFQAPEGEPEMEVTIKPPKKENHEYTVGMPDEDL